MLREFIMLLTVLMMIGLDGSNAHGDTNRIIAVNNLRCEYKTNPLGIDVLKPRLSWTIASDQRGQKQTAYQILVATDKDKLTPGKADLWDTGKIESDQTIQIEYDGKPLQSRMRCYWKVHVWAADKKTTASSKPAFWTMGLLQENDFEAKWIGFDDHEYDPVTNAEKKVDEDFKQANWIAYPGAKSECHFAKLLDIPADKIVRKAMCVITGRGRTWLWVNGRESARTKTPTAAARIDITESIKPGINHLVIRTRENKNDSSAVIAAFRIEFENAEPVIILTDNSWKTAKDRPADWVYPEPHKEQWKHVESLGPYKSKGDAVIIFAELYVPPPRYMCKDFTIDNTIKSATLYASALGLYKAHINGQPVGEDYFTPGWTNYKKRVYYNTYDVTNMVTTGNNALATILADGWYAGYVGGGRRRARYSQKTRFFAQLEIELANGTRKIIHTDESWKASTGPTYEADFLMGEFYDARKEIPGWDKSDFNDTLWKPVTVEKSVTAKIEAYPGVTVKKFQEIKPISLTEPKPGRFVFDMGTNFAGIVRLKAKGQPGRKIMLTFAERLNPDGTVYVTNLRFARAVDTYICDGNDRTWQPQFTFHGFQYVELTGYPSKPNLNTITGIELTSATPPSGRFTCSDETANQLYKNICQTQRSNFIDIPTDCPQRDERLGWTGDVQIYARASTYNTDTSAFFTKWLIDLKDAQLSSGAYTDVAPSATRQSGGTAAWADAGTVCPWTMYEVYGDTRILEKYYKSMSRWIKYCKDTSRRLIRPDKGYGDWLSIDADTAKDALATAYFAYSTKLMAHTADVLGKKEDAQKYRELFEQIKDTFNYIFVTKDARIKSDTQTAYVLALAFDLLDKDKKTLAQKHLIENIQKRNWHLSTGFVGTKDLMRVLTNIGRTDVAYHLFHNQTFPSWGFSIRHGATSIWERWDGWTPKKGFQDPRMNSFAHYSFGAVAEWMFKTIGGIDTDGPAYKNIIIHPRPGGNLTWAKTSYDSIHGTIATDWKLENNSLILNVTIPANTSATVYIPTDSKNNITESGTPAENAQGVTFIRKENNNLIYKILSGSYSFEALDVEPIKFFE